MDKSVHVLGGVSGRETQSRDVEADAQGAELQAERFIIWKKNPSDKISFGFSLCSNVEQ